MKCISTLSKGLISLSLTLTFISGCSLTDKLGLKVGDGGPLNTPIGKILLPMPNLDEMSFTALRSTIYYTPEIDVRNLNCASQEEVVSTSGEVLTSMCTKDFNGCLMEGSCRIVDSSETYLVTVARVVSGHASFTKSSIKECPYGKGVEDRCLDPFFTVAADERYFQAGDVIYVKEVRGTFLPDGSTHSGYFIVRDIGGAIKGPNRFDFFSGDLRPSDPKNPFQQIGLSATDKFHFAPVTGELADLVRKERKF